MATQNPTTNYGWTMPTVGASDGAWGGILNGIIGDDATGIDAVLQDFEDRVSTVEALVGVIPGAVPAIHSIGYTLGGVAGLYSPVKDHLRVSFSDGTLGIPWADQMVINLDTINTEAGTSFDVADLLVGSVVQAYFTAAPSVMVSARVTGVGTHPAGGGSQMITLKVYKLDGTQVGAGVGITAVIDLMFAAPA